MPNHTPDSADRHAEMLDVQLLDVFGEIEALMRAGREIQREALRLRGLPTPVNAVDRQTAGQAIRQHLDQMHIDCRALGGVIKQLQTTAKQLDTMLNGKSKSA